MTKWEHMQQTMRNGDYHIGVLDELGKEGWELVLVYRATPPVDYSNYLGTPPVAKDEDCIFIFKRPLEEDDRLLIATDTITNNHGCPDPLHHDTPPMVKDGTP